VTPSHKTMGSRGGLNSMAIVLLFVRGCFEVALFI
jgi:hypothetical protein